MSNVSERETAEYDAVVVGAGFAGLYMLHRLRKLGLRVRLFERADGVGGTWYWNRYPGARCDVESLAYSYSFDEDLVRDWNWTERYATQSEILSYLNHVADRFGLRADIQLNTTITSAAYEHARWTVETAQGDRIACQYLILATGCLSDSHTPPFPGIESFAGACYHTGRWPHEPVSFAGKRVAIIGTGSSGIQATPVIAAQAEHTFVLQRTPLFSVPARNAPVPEDDAESRTHRHMALRKKVLASPLFMPFETAGDSASAASDAELEAAVEKRWLEGGLSLLQLYPDQMLSADAAERIGKVVKEKIRAKVNDPALAKRLMPEFLFGAKRLCVDTNYFETFNRDNVTLVDLREERVKGIVAEGILTNRRTIGVDVIVCATGFDALTGSILKMNLVGRDGLTIKQKWAKGSPNYLGLMISGFPNLFTITGPGSPSVFTNMVPSIEQHVDWIANCITWLREKQLTTIEASAEAEAAWVAQNNQMASATILPLARSWYMGRNIAGKPQAILPFVGGTLMYRTLCEKVVAEGYRGFVLGNP